MNYHNYMLTSKWKGIPYTRDVKLIFPRGHISFVVTFKGPNVILGLYKCNYSLTRGKELYIQPSEGNSEADVAPVKTSLTSLP